MSEQIVTLDDRNTRPVTLRGKHAIARYCGPGISVHIVRAALVSGELPSLNITGAYVVLTEDVDAWLRSLRVKATA